MTRTRSALPDPDPAATATLADASKVVGWGLTFWGAVQLAGAVFGRSALGLAAVQAVLAEWGAGRIGISWSDPLAPSPAWRDLARRVGKGAAFGACAAGMVILVSVVTRSAAHASARPGIGLLAVGFIASGLSSVRDELLLRGVVIRATRGLLPAGLVLVVCAAAAAAARLGVDGAFGMALAVEAARGAALGVLWMRDRGAWQPVAANTAWTWTLGSIVRGGVVDLRFATEPDAGIPALAVLCAALGAAVLAAFAAGRWPAGSTPRRGR